MGWPDTPADTEVEALHKKLDSLLEQNERIIAALNGLGANMQWILDNVKDIFQMFKSPMFTGMVGNMISGGVLGGGNDGTGDDGTGDDGDE